MRSLKINGAELTSEGTQGLTSEPCAVAFRAKVGEIGGVWVVGPKRVGWWQCGPSKRMRLSCKPQTTHQYHTTAFTQTIDQKITMLHEASQLSKL